MHWLDSYERWLFRGSPLIVGGMRGAGPTAPGFRRLLRELLLQAWAVLMGGIGIFLGSLATLGSTPLSSWSPLSWAVLSLGLLIVVLGVALLVLRARRGTPENEELVALREQQRRSDEERRRSDEESRRNHQTTQDLIKKHIARTQGGPSPGLPRDDAPAQGTSGGPVASSHPTGQDGGGGNS